ncbi:MAG: DUF4160 domain-containing protein [Sulfitobacter sp.]
MSEWRIPFEGGATESLLAAIRAAEASERRAMAQRGFMELLVEKFKDIKIEIYAKEHPPPHFHVKTNNGNASFTISDCELVDGDYFLARRMKEIRNWHAQYKDELIDCWNKTRPSDCPVGEYRGKL